MKHLICVVATFLVIATAKAQTGAAQSTTNKPTEIFSDSAVFDLKTRVVTYSGHVRVTDPQMKLTCDDMVVRTAEAGGHIESIVAEGNVVVDIVNPQGETNHATGKRLVYTYKVENSVTNDMAVLTGDPRMEQADSWLTGDSISWDRATGNIRVSNPHGVSKVNLIGGPGSSPTTNEPAATGPGQE